MTRYARPTPMEIGACFPEWAIVSCGCGPRPVRCSCGSLECHGTCHDCGPDGGLKGCRRCGGCGYEGCAKGVGRARGARAAARLMSAFETTGIVVVTMTVPEQRRARFYDPAEWVKVRRRARRALRAVLGDRTWGFEASHPCGECRVCARKPKSVRASCRACQGTGNDDGFHPHLNFVLQPGRQRAFLLPGELAELKRRWKRALGMPQNEPVNLWVHVHAKWLHGPQLARFHHACRYNARAFPGWGFWLPKMAWWGSTEARSPFPPRERPKCAKCGDLFRLVARPATPDELRVFCPAHGARAPPATSAQLRLPL